MTVHSPRAQARARRYGFLLALVAGSLFSLSAHADPPPKAAEIDRLVEEGRKAVVEERLVDAFDKFPPAPTASEPKAAPAPPPSPAPSELPNAPRSPADHLLRSPLMWTAAGLALVSGGIALGAHITEVNTRTDMERAIPRMSVEGCRGDKAPLTTACAAFRDASESNWTAETVRTSALIISSGLFAATTTGAAVFEWMRTPIQVVPTVGGVMVRGTF